MPAPVRDATRRMVVEVIDDATAAMFRAMTPAQRVKVASDAHRTAKRLVAAGVRYAHPDWSHEAVHREVRRRLLGQGAGPLILEALAATGTFQPRTDLSLHQSPLRSEYAGCEVG